MSAPVSWDEKDRTCQKLYFFKVIFVPRFNRMGLHGPSFIVIFSQAFRSHRRAVEKGRRWRAWTPKDKRNVIISFIGQHTRKNRIRRRTLDIWSGEHYSPLLRRYAPSMMLVQQAVQNVECGFVRCVLCHKAASPSVRFIS